MESRQSARLITCSRPATESLRLRNDKRTRLGLASIALVYLSVRGPPRLSLTLPQPMRTSSNRVRSPDWASVDVGMAATSKTTKAISLRCSLMIVGFIQTTLGAATRGLPDGLAYDNLLCIPQPHLHQHRFAVCCRNPVDRLWWRVFAC